MGKWSAVLHVQGRSGLHVAHMRERRVVYWVLVGKPVGKRAHGKPRHRWEDNIKMDLQEVGCGGD